MGRKKIYVVFVGRSTGIFESWADCSKEVLGFSGSCFRGYNTIEEAIEEYESYFGRITVTPHKVNHDDEETKNKIQYQTNGPNATAEETSTSLDGNEKTSANEVSSAFAVGFLLGSMSNLRIRHA
ncbi:uncharacterized protein LOC133824108 [Humulus lupulus]|uniref:uncharacterized protein LOC133824108 n=1 Tax=Humulus lupulus TaxID=3486 RepID=UPI002B40AB7B|nr:uncharacterized protein LOC133824108 [Humulus lupulus]